VEATRIAHEGSDQTLYWIDVEDTHNFVTSGGVVHNCRPPGNRNPEPDEMQKCEPFLQRQIELLQPKLIVALGRIAAQNLLSRDASIASLRGRVHDFNGLPLIVTYHPAYLLRNLTDKAKAWEDLCFAVSTMQRLQSAAVTPT
jgi:DNA polymerase